MPAWTNISEETIARVRAYLEENEHAPVSTMVDALKLSEAEITFSLPKEMVFRGKGEKTQAILEALPAWGHLTVIVHSAGSIFEFKADFPKGKLGHGFYNLMGKEGQLHGHLRIDEMCDIAFVSKPFRGSQSHYIAFFNEQGRCIFKVYLGRDKKRQLFPEQIERFTQMKQEWAI